MTSNEGNQTVGLTLIHIWNIEKVFKCYWGKTS